MIRSIKTVVFPDPAEAEIKRLVPRWWMACHWSSLKRLPGGWVGITCLAFID